MRRPDLASPGGLGRRRGRAKATYEAKVQTSRDLEARYADKHFLSEREGQARRERDDAYTRAEDLRRMAWELEQQHNSLRSLVQPPVEWRTGMPASGRGRRSSDASIWQGTGSRRRGPRTRTIRAKRKPGERPGFWIDIGAEGDRTPDL